MKRRKHRRSSFTFNNVPIIKRPRTLFPMQYSIRTTAQVGDLVPYDIQEVYSGDTWKMSETFVSRTSSPMLRPVMDNAFVEFHHFYVPLRTLYNDYTKVITGSNGDGEPEDWNSEFEGSVPCIPKGSIIPPDTIGDCLGLPVNMPLGRDVSVLPFRAVAKIYNEYYRDENTTKSTVVQLGDFNEEVETPNNNDWSYSNYCGKLPKVFKYKDYFTSALPQPQKGEAVEIPQFLSQNIPVEAMPDFIPNADNLKVSALFKPSGDVGQSFNNLGGSYGLPAYLGNALYSPTTPGESKPTLRFAVPTPSETSIGNSTPYEQIYGGQTYVDLIPQNLWAMSNGIALTGMDVNDMRLAFALQKIKERTARGGSRYTEYILNTFGVRAPDSSLQRAEFLGGRRLPLGYQQAVQQSQSTESGVLGEVGAYGLSSGRNGYSKAFTENGYIISFLSIRYRHSYQQGIRAFWGRKNRFDFYDPTFMNIGEQPIYATELYGRADEDRVFGYKGAWDELRVCPSMTTRQMRSPSVRGDSISQDLYHYSDVYGSTPVLSTAFLQENSEFFDRTLSVDSSAQDPFIFDIFCKGHAIRVLNEYSLPSLIDHN